MNGLCKPQTIKGTPLATPGWGRNFVQNRKWLRRALQRIATWFGRGIITHLKIHSYGRWLKLVLMLSVVALLFATLHSYAIVRHIHTDWQFNKLSCAGRLTSSSSLMKLWTWNGSKSLKIISLLRVFSRLSTKYPGTFQSLSPPSKQGSSGRLSFKHAEHVSSSLNIVLADLFRLFKLRLHH